MAENCKLGNAAVLGLDSAKAVESLLVSVFEEAERIPEAKGGLGTNYRHIQSQ